MMRSLATGALLAHLLLAGGCRSCHERVYHFAVDDAQVARVTEGTAAPTARGCNIVCYEVSRQRDAGAVYGGLPASSPIQVESCSLSGHQLTCDFGTLCEV